MTACPQSGGAAALRSELDAPLVHVTSPQLCKHDAGDSSARDGEIAADLGRQRRGDTAPSRKDLKEGKRAQSECTVRASTLWLSISHCIC